MPRRLIRTLFLIVVLGLGVLALGAVIDGASSAAQSAERVFAAAREWSSRGSTCAALAILSSLFEAVAGGHVEIGRVPWISRAWRSIGWHLFFLASACLAAGELHLLVVLGHWPALTGLVAAAAIAGMTAWSMDHHAAIHVAWVQVLLIASVTRTILRIALEPAGALGTGTDVLFLAVSGGAVVVTLCALVRAGHPGNLWQQMVTLLTDNGPASEGVRRAEIVLIASLIASQVAQ